MAESDRVKTIYLVFTVAFVSRTVIFFYNVFAEYKYANMLLIYFCFYNIWDVMPLTLIMIYHKECYDA